MLATLYRPDPKELMSLGRLARTHDGEILMQVLLQEFVVVKDRLIKETELSLIPNLQGRAQFLSAMLDLMKQQSTKDHTLS